MLLFFCFLFFFTSDRCPCLSLSDSFPGSCCSLNSRWAKTDCWDPSYFCSSLPFRLTEPSSVSVLSPALLSTHRVTLSVLCACVCVFCQMKDRGVIVVYHEPDGVRHLSEDLRGIRGNRSHPTTPEDGVEPGLIHWVDCHTHIIGLILPGGKEKYRSRLGKGPFRLCNKNV